MPSRICPAVSLSVRHGLVILWIACADGPLAADGQLEISVVERDTGKPIACRMHLKNAAGRPRFPKPSVAWDDHFIVPGRILLKLPAGKYNFEMERGPEYPVRSGYFTIQTSADDTKNVDMQRYVDMSASGWWSGDLDVRRRADDIELVMQAEDLHVVPLLTWGNGHGAHHESTKPSPANGVLRQFAEKRYCQVMGGEHCRPGGTLLYFNLPSPIPLGSAEEEYPPTLKYLGLLRKQPGTWVDLSRPYGWDLPMLVALGQIDSVQVAHSNLCRGKVIGKEEGGKARDPQRYASPLAGNARWSQDIYFHLLNCGLRIPPSAGSGSGLAPNPAGYNRVYVHVDGEFSYEAWWEGLRAGRATITNGPLLRPTVHGELPGHVFQADAGAKLEFEIGLSVDTRDPMTYLEIVKDGKVAHEVRFDQYAKSGRLPKVVFDRSGWFLVRIVADETKTYRFAMTAPYYVEIGYERRISRQSAQFFVDWVLERARALKLSDAQQQREVLECHRKARDFWQGLLEKANVE